MKSQICPAPSIRHDERESNPKFQIRQMKNVVHGPRQLVTHLSSKIPTRFREITLAVRERSTSTWRFFAEWRVTPGKSTRFLKYYIWNTIYCIRNTICCTWNTIYAKHDISLKLWTKMCIRLHEMITLLLCFFRNIIKYDKTSENPKWAGLQNMHTSSRNDDPFVTFLQEYHKMW